MDRETEGREYLAQHKIPDLLHTLSALLLFHRPALESLGLSSQDEPYGETDLITQSVFKENVMKKYAEMWAAF